MSTMPTIPNPAARLEFGPAPEVDIREVVSRLATVLGQVREAVDAVEHKALDDDARMWLSWVQMDAGMALSKVDDLLDHVDATWRHEGNDR